MNISDEVVKTVTDAIFDASDGINAELIHRHDAEVFARAALRVLDRLPKE